MNFYKQTSKVNEYLYSFNKLKILLFRTSLEKPKPTSLFSLVYFNKNLKPGGSFLLSKRARTRLENRRFKPWRRVGSGERFTPNRGKLLPRVCGNAEATLGIILRVTEAGSREFALGEIVSTTKTLSTKRTKRF